MTDNELHAAIAANPTAKNLADKGDDVGAAKEISKTLPNEVREFTYVFDRGVVAAFPDPTVGEAFLGGLELASQNNPVIARVLKWLSPSEGGIDVGNPVVRGQLDHLSTLNIPGITTETVAVLKALAENPANISPDEVSRAWLRYRQDGRIS